MKGLGLVGVDWRVGGTEELIPYTIPGDERVGRLPELRRRIGVRELVYLATCNRVELTFVGDRETPVSVYRQRIFSILKGRHPGPREAERSLRAWTGEGAAEHLFRVASGLESAMVGEPEIVGQMREALAQAEEADTRGPILEWLFGESFRVGREVRRATRLGRDRSSLAEVALETIRERLEAAPGPVAVVGVSPMTTRCARDLAERGVPVHVYNRSLSRAETLAEEVGGRAASLAELTEGEIPALAVIVCATGAAEAVLDRTCLERLRPLDSGHLPLIVDMAVQPDVDPAVAAEAGLERVGLDEILELAGESASRDAQETGLEIIDRSLARLEDKLIDRVVAPMFAALQRRYQAAAEEGVDRLLQRHLSELSDEQEEDVRRWAQALARRFAHIPTTGLRALSRAQGFEALERFFAEGDEALAAELEAAREDSSYPVPEGMDVELVRHGRKS